MPNYLKTLSPWQQSVLMGLGMGMVMLTVWLEPKTEAILVVGVSLALLLAWTTYLSRIAQKHSQSRDQANKECKKAKTERDRFFNLSLDMLCTVGFDGTFNRLSSSWEQILGYQQAELLDHPLVDFIHPEDQSATLAELEQLRTGQRTCRFENRYRSKDGTYRRLAWTATSFPPEDLICAVARDATEHQQTAEIRQALEQEKALGKQQMHFFALASHKLRTPLSVILLAADILAHSDPQWLDTKRLRSIRRIQNNTNQMRQILTDVLTLVRLEAQQAEFNPTPVNLQEFSARILAEHQTDSSASAMVQATYDGENHEVMMDETLLHPILTNLLCNAIKYSPSGGGINCNISLQKERAIFTITDQGIGIPLSDQEHLYDAFYRGRNIGRIEGAGLGLAIAKKCVDLHGGEMKFESHEGTGTTVTVQIPTHSLTAKNQNQSNQSNTMAKP